MKYSKITISGKICTGKSSLFKQLTNKLAWPTIHTGKIFRQYVKEHKLSLEEGKEQNTIAKKIDSDVKDKLEKPGNLIVDSWVAGISADELPDVLRILLVCDDKIRAKRFSDRENISVSESLKKIKKRENNVLVKLKKLYNRSDFFNAKKYNFVIDTTNLTKTQVFQKVLQKLK